MAIKATAETRPGREARWDALARELIRKEVLRRGLGLRDLAEEAGLDRVTLSRLVNGKPGVGETSWFRVGATLGWGSWLDLVKTGSIDAVNRYGDVHPDIRDYAVERLREIADSNP